MDHLVYPRERTLATLTLVLGIVAWLLLIIGTFGTALIGLGLAFLIYLFAQSALIAYIRGNGVELSTTQMPDLYHQFTACCDRLNIKARPQIYILNGNGGLNAFATKFLGAEFVVLLSDVVDAMAKHDDGVSFYIGHELGHLRMKHLRGQLFRWPVLWLPLLGAAYSRARESTCDRHGAACCASPEGAARALTALSAGPERWQQLDMASYKRQALHTSGFWMSFHELTNGYPWLTKRALRVLDVNGTVPPRSPMAALLAAFIPYAGRLGAGFGFIMLIYIVGIVAAIAIPAYQDYTVKAKVSTAVTLSQGARDALGRYYTANHQPPPSLASAGVSPQLANGAFLSLDPKTMILSIGVDKGELVFVPNAEADGQVTWRCTNGEGLKPSQMPPPCHPTTSPIPGSP